MIMSREVCLVCDVRERACGVRGLRQQPLLRTRILRMPYNGIYTQADETA